MPPTSVYIHSAGCVRRALDATRLREFFAHNGCLIARSPEHADYILLVTCGFMKSKEEKCLELVRKFGQLRGQLLVLGCLPETAPEKLKLCFTGPTIATRNIHEIDRFFPDFTHKLADAPDANSLTYSTKHDPASTYAVLQQCLAPYRLQHPLRERQPPRDYSRLLYRTAKELWTEILWPNFGRHKITPGYLRISSGCLEACSYCSIRKAIGPLKSKPLAEILVEYKQLLREGYRVIELQADNIGAYGLDIGSSLAELLTRLTVADGDAGARWMIKELHPKWAIRYREQLRQAISKRKILSLHCPIQSGSRRVLQLMNRVADVDLIAQTLQQLKAANRHMSLSTHIIAGFPTETDPEFDETIHLVERIGFSGVFIFPYHESEGSPAAKIGPPDEVATARRIGLAQQEFSEHGIIWRCP